MIANANVNCNHGFAPMITDDIRNFRSGVLMLALMFALLGGLVACTTPAPLARPSAKITFDLRQLDDAGLIGPADGKVALSYEFCIPSTAACEAEVRAIDPSVQLARGSRGRIGCVPDQTLCIGSTHQPHFRRVLESLAALSYVARIDQCFFE